MPRVSGQSVAQLAFPQTLNAHSRPARRQLCLGTLKVRANFRLIDGVEAGTAHDPPLPQAHHPACGNEGYELPGTGAWALLPSVDPQVFLNCIHQPIHGEPPIACSESHNVPLRAPQGWPSDAHGGRNQSHQRAELISSSACPTEEIIEKHYWTVR